MPEPIPVATLKTSYTDLAADERRLLQVLSLMHAAYPASTILSVLEDSGLKEPGTTLRSLKKCLESLTRKGLAIEKSSRFTCADPMRETATRDAVRDGLLQRAVTPIESLPRRTNGAYRPGPGAAPDDYLDPDECARDLRLALYQGKEDRFLELLGVYSQFPTNVPKISKNPLWLMATAPFDPAWWLALPSRTAETILSSIEHGATYHREEAQPLLDWLQERDLRGESPGLTPALRLDLASQAVHSGRFAVARSLLDKATGPVADGLRGAIAVMTGKYDEAVALFGPQATNGKKKRVGAILDTEFSALYPLALLALGRSSEAGILVGKVLADRAHPCSRDYSVLSLATHLALGQALDGDLVPYMNSTPRMDTLLTVLVLYWHKPILLKQYASDIETAITLAVKKGMHWLAAELLEVVARVMKNPAWQQNAREWRQSTGTRPLVDVIRTIEPWERTLCALKQQFSASSPAASEDQRSLRLVWDLGVTQHGDRLHLDLRPREQTHNASGWTRGRAVALKRLYDQHRSMEHLCDVDRQVCECIEARYVQNGYYRDVVYDLDVDRALPRLMGHPHLYQDGDPDTVMEIVDSRPALRLEKHKGHLLLRFDPPGSAHSDVEYALEGTRLLKRFVFTQDDRRMAALLGDGLRMPTHALSQVQDVLTCMAGRITVHSDFGGSAEVETDGDPRIHVLLSPLGEGLGITVCVRPLGPSGPSLAPGAGGETVIATVDGVTQKTRRDLAAERQAWAAVQSACPMIGEARTTLTDTTECLEMLQGLESLGDAVCVLWPEGVRFRITRYVQWKDLTVKVADAREWFAIGGGVEVDEGRVLELRSLLQERGFGRFIPLGEGAFAALTGEFVRRLDELKPCLEMHHDGVRMHGLTSLMAHEILEGTSLKASRRWKERLNSFLEQKDEPVPSTLQAELRDYQVEGFRWLIRLANWGAGACLADDMGLGKTVQALAMLLQRASRGPALVVAPTSVCGNWIEEAERFAPTLNVRLYAGPDRAALLDGLAPFDVVVTSYTLLHQDAEPLSTISWTTAILDEAQAIKNATTRRSQAAMGLQADFRLITTGTPIENHLGELWTLFRFLNPGLLSTKQEFERRFATPIERGDSSARAGLKRLLAPFILRRTKTQVLNELPTRTDITLHVDLTPEERALYESLRRQAIETISKQKGQQARMQVLAELMRLRRACCHPRLVRETRASTTASSAKLEAFGELLEELLENRHKALVFSQFVDHLEVVRKYLDDQGVAYQYLDGSTPMAERQQRVAAFQAGQGDVFLISLRAGGSGLNLTAADYVIHLDPWWNPAVEDQASDRAHRIGQQRPVTVYRIVARDTVEDRIVDLHRRKRDLAESMLEGTEAATRVTAADLLRLLEA